MSGTAPLVVSTADESAPTLQQRFQRYGYLYFPRHIAAAKCDSLLQKFQPCLDPYVSFDHGSRHGLLKGSSFYETDSIWDEVYPRIQSIHEFHDFFHQQDVRELMRILVGEDIFVYPMKMGRISTPGRVGFETPPHQDAHSHQAGPTMAGIWVALHDISEGMGRLQLLPKSHQRGVRRVIPAEGVGGVQCEIFPDEDVWHVSDVKQGDVIIFHSCCVHRAEPNTSSDSVRISIDTRFCDYGAPVFVTNLEPHHGWRIEGLDWDNIYRTWEDKSLQYYWEDYPGLFSELQVIAE